MFVNEARQELPVTYPADSTYSQVKIADVYRMLKKQKVPLTHKV